MDENKKPDLTPEAIRKMIDDQLDLIQNAVMGPNGEELTKTARSIFSNLPADEIKDDEPIYFTINHDVGLMIKKGDTLYWWQHDHAVRLRKTEARGLIADAFKKGKLVASDILPSPN